MFSVVVVVVELRVGLQHRHVRNVYNFLSKINVFKTLACDLKNIKLNYIKLYLCIVISL